jgi:hypothetical protein
MRASARLCAWQCFVRLCVSFVLRSHSVRSRPQRAARSTLSAYPSAPPDVPVVGNRCGRAPPRALRGVACAGQRLRRARGYLRHRQHRPHQRRRLDPHEHIGARALPSTLLSTRAPRLPSGGSAPPMRRAVPHGVGCECPQYPAGVAASVRSTHSAVGYRRLTLGRAPPRACAACGVQAYKGGLVGISGIGGTVNVSVVGSTLANISVRAHCLSTLSSTRAPRLPSGGSAPLMRRAVPHGVGCEYPQYPAGCTASVRSTHSTVGYRRLTLWAGAAASFARRGVGRPLSAGSWNSPASAPATSASSARPSRTYRCARTAEYPLEYPRTAAPVRRLRIHAPHRAARRGLRVPAVPCRCCRLAALVLTAQWGTAG